MDVMTEGEIVIEYDMQCDICGYVPDKLISFQYNHTYDHSEAMSSIQVCLSCLYRAVNMLKSEPALAVTPL